MNPRLRFTDYGSLLCHLATIPIFRVTERAALGSPCRARGPYRPSLHSGRRYSARHGTAWGKLYFPRTWAVAPGQEDVPLEGRDRFQLDGFSLPAFQFEEEPGTIRLDD